MTSIMNSLWTLFLLVCAVHMTSSISPDCETKGKYSPNVDATKVAATFEKTSTLLEKLLTEEKIVEGVISMTGKVLGICEHLPVVGAGFALLGAGVEIFVPKPDSTELKCMRAEFDKINGKLDKIQEKLEQVEKKLNDIVKVIERQTIYKEYNQYFKEPILRLFASYQNYVRYNMTKYKQDSLVFSCLNDQPIFALDWLDRTLRNTNDPSGLPLMDFIFETIKCDHEKVVAWTESIFYHVALAATLDQLCFGTYVQQKSQASLGNIKEMVDQPEFQNLAKAANRTITSAIKVFQAREKKRQEACFEEAANEIIKKQLLEQKEACTCSKPLNMDIDRQQCQPFAKLEARFGLMEKTICLMPNSMVTTIPTSFAKGITMLNPMGTGQFARNCFEGIPSPHIYIRPGNACSSAELQQPERDRIRSTVLNGEVKCFSNGCPKGFKV